MPKPVPVIFDRKNPSFRNDGIQIFQLTFVYFNLFATKIARYDQLGKKCQINSIKS